jgi:hypothetical protein
MIGMRRAGRQRDIADGHIHKHLFASVHVRQQFFHVAIRDLVVDRAFCIHPRMESEPGAQRRGSCMTGKLNAVVADSFAFCRALRLVRR